MPARRAGAPLAILPLAILPLATLPLATLLLATLLLGAGPAIARHPGVAAPPVVVSSKMDTEGELLGALILDTLARAGIAAADRTGLGPTSLVRAALLAGQVDLYPEYTGNGAIFFHREGDPAFREAGAGARLDAALDRPNGIVWLPPAPADNSWAIAVAPAVARAGGLASLADLGPYLARHAGFRLAASSEFVESEAALPALERAYGFHLGGDRLLVLAGGATEATERAAAGGISGLSASMAYGTDGALALLDLVVLSDPRRAEPVYAPAVTVRRAVLDAHPEAAPLLSALFARLDQATLRRLNARIAACGLDPRTVAASFLDAPGLDAPGLDAPAPDPRRDLSAPC